MKTSRIFCIGRNYAEHAAELGNPVPSEPVIFIKPLTSLLQNSHVIQYPNYGTQLQHEVEVIVQIGKTGRVNNPRQAREFISAISLGLDLTLRDIQKNLKEKGLPWEKAKAFDSSAPIARWIPLIDNIDLANIEFWCSVNGQLRQKGNTAQMLNSITQLVQYISTIWVLMPGDIIFTGTPKGVGDLLLGDKVDIVADMLNIEQTFYVQNQSR